MKLSVFTASTPWLALPELIPAVAEAGYTGIEIGFKDRVYDPAKPPQFWNNNPAILDYGRAEDEAHAARAAIDAAKLDCCALGTYANLRDVERFPTCFAVAKILDAEIVRVWPGAYESGRSYADQLAERRAVYRDLGAIAQAQGTRVCIELHNGSFCPSASSVMRVLDGLDPVGVGVILDLANMVREGWEALPQMLASLGPYLAHVHVKDVAITTDATVRDARRADFPFVPLGRGVLDWSGIVKALRGIGYDGWYSVENFSGADVGVPRLKQDRDWLAGLFA